VPEDRPVLVKRDAERARNVARLWIGLAALFAVLAVLQWLSNDDLWSRLLSTSGALAYAGVAWQARRKAREAAARGKAGDAGTAV
jgi:hypothetical protein